MAKFNDRMAYGAAKSMIDSLETIPTSELEAGVIPDDLISALAKLNLTQQKALIRRAQHYLAVDLNTAALERQLKEIEETREERELEDTYLLLGAPLKLMRRLFGMHAAEFSRRRNALKIRGSGSGRPPHCDEQTELFIWELWSSKDTQEERQRFLAVAEESGCDLHIIWSVLRQHLNSSSDVN